MTRYLLLLSTYGLVFVGRTLWREDGSVFCICCWPLPAQSCSGPSPLGLATLFYSLRFETFLFIASYDSQGHGGGIRPRLHTDVETPLVSFCYIASGWAHREHSSVSYANRNCVCVAQKMVVYQEAAALATAFSRCFVSAGTCLPSFCLVINRSSDFTIPAFERHVTIQ
jgi:hypothetical protein